MLWLKPKTKVTKLLAGFFTLSLRFAVILTLLVVIAFGTMGGCHGGGSNGEKQEFRIFDVGFSGLEFGDDFFGNCSEANIATLLLKLLFDAENVSGTAELVGFNMTGPSTAIIGMVEGTNISFEPFSVTVDDGTNVVGFGPSSVRFSFSSFEGMIFDNDGDQSPDEITGTVSGMVVEILEGDIVLCSGSFSGDFDAVLEDNGSL